MCHQLFIQLYMRVPSLISRLKQRRVSKIFSKYAAVSGTFKYYSHTPPPPLANKKCYSYVASNFFYVYKFTP